MIHGTKYDYSHVRYLGISSAVKIICHDHGVFLQKADYHLQGNGCAKCGILKRSKSRVERNAENFVEKAKKIHRDRYDYEKVVYKNVKHKVEISCKKHGPFLQTPDDHLNQRAGCKKCAHETLSITRSMGVTEFIKRAHDVHDHEYNYDKCEYINIDTKVSIMCLKHGLFKQTPFNHLRGQKCPECACYGFNPLSSGFVYFLLSEETNCIKVGITNDLKTRLRSLKRSTPFPFVLIKTVSMKGEHCRQLETRYHTQYESANLTGFDGATEWLKYSKDLMNDIFNID